MKKVFTILFLTWCICVLGGRRSYAQMASNDSSWQRLQIRQARSYGENEFSGPNSAVYQGYEYVPYILPTSGNAFYPSGNWQQGSVDFKGVEYHDLPLLYDIYKDQLVLQSPDKLYRIALSMNDVSGFQIGDLRFLRILRKTGSSTARLASGYYELLYAGGDSLLARRTKTVNVPTEAGTSRSFMEQDAYYIKKDGSFYPVSTKRSVLSVFNGEKNALKKFIRKNDLRFSKNRQQAMIKVVEYEDQIKK